MSLHNYFFSIPDGPYWKAKERREQMSQPTDLRSSAEWQEEFKDIIEVLDPDGWDRSPKGWEDSWNEPIPEEEWWRRVNVSTCIFKDTNAVNRKFYG